MIGHLALANPSVSFVLKHNGREQLRVDANGDAANTLVAVLGRDTAKQMLPITGGDENEGIQVTGFVGRPQLTRANRNGQLFFVNGRAIRSQVLQHAFRAAYEGLIHGRDRYPVGVIFLRVAPGEVDVNVHPTKSEVRFVNEGEAHHALRVAVQNTLVGAQLAPSFGLAPEQPGRGDKEKAQNNAGESVTATTPRLPGIESRPATPPAPSQNGSAPSVSTNPTTAARPFTPTYTPSQSAISQPLTPTPTAEDRAKFAQHLRDVRNGTVKPQEFPDPDAQPTSQPSAPSFAPSQPVAAP